MLATLTMRSYSGETDLQLIAELYYACWMVEPHQDCCTISELRQEFSAPNFDPSQDIGLWEMAGELVGFSSIVLIEAEVGTTGFLEIRIHPKVQYQDLEPEVYAWAEQRMQQIGQSRAITVTLMAGCLDNQLDRIALLEDRGFIRERCFLTLSRSLTEPVPTPELPEGFVLADARLTLDEQASIDLYNQTFIDHWNFHPLTLERLRYYLSAPDYRPELDLVAIAPDGTYSAFCFCSIYVSENERQGCAVGWVNSLGTRRGFRRLGLGRALLLIGLHRLQQAGMAVAKLGVDVDNPHQAKTLYESVGFQKDYTRLAYCKPIPSSLV